MRRRPVLSLAVGLSLVAAGALVPTAASGLPTAPSGVATAAFDPQPAPRQLYGYSLLGADREFDGAAGYPRNTDVGYLDDVAEGALSVRFATSSPAAQTLFSLSDATTDDTWAALGVADGAVTWTVVVDGQVRADVRAPVPATDGAPHTVSVGVSAGFTQVSFDGFPALLTTSDAFLATVPDPTAVTFGARATSAGTTAALTGTIDRVTVHDRVLGPTDLASASVMRVPTVRADATDVRARLDVPAAQARETWVFTGDSITHGAAHTRGYRSWSQQVEERVRWELRRFGDQTVNTAISGDTAAGILATWDERVATHDPTVVVTMVGMNDVVLLGGAAGLETFRAQVTEIVERTRALGAVPVLATSQPVRGGGAGTNRATYPQYVQVVREVAAAQDTVLVDNYARWMLEHDGNPPSTLWSDDIHPGPQGHLAFAQTFLEDLGAWDGSTGVGALRLPTTGQIQQATTPLGTATQAWGFTHVPSSFDGTRVVDRSADLATLRGLDEGTLLVRFAAQPGNGGTLLSMSDTSAPAASPTALTVALRDGRLEYAVTRGGTDLVRTTTTTRFDDGQQHVVAVAVGQGVVTTYVDGSPVVVAPGRAFVADVAPDALTVAGTRTAAGVSDRFTGTITRTWAMRERLTPLRLNLDPNAVVLPDYAAVRGVLSRGDRDASRPWLFAGDSITHGALHTNGWRSWTQHVEERVRWERNYRHDYVITTATSGAKVADLVADYEGRIGRHDAAVVTIMIGMNDSPAGAAGLPAFRQNLTTLVERVRADGGVPVLATSQPVVSRAWYPEYVQAVRDVAAAERVFVVDNYADWLVEDQGEVPTSQLNDAIHPNAQGHVEFARTFLDGFGVWDPGSALATVSTVRNSTLGLAVAAGGEVAPGGTVAVTATATVGAEAARDVVLALVPPAGTSLAAAPVASTGTVRLGTDGAYRVVLPASTPAGTVVTVTAQVAVPGDVAAGTALRTRLEGALTNTAARPTTAVATTVVTAPAGPAVTARAEVRCLAGKAYVAVAATNDDDAPVDVRVVTPFGTRDYTGVQPGGSAYQSFAVRSASVAAGEATVDAARTGTDGTGTVVAAWDDRTCG